MAKYTYCNFFQYTWRIEKYVEGRWVIVEILEGRTIEEALKALEARGVGHQLLRVVAEIRSYLRSCPGKSA